MVVHGPVWIRFDQPNLLFKPTKIIQIGLNWIYVFFLSNLNQTNPFKNGLGQTVHALKKIFLDCKKK